MLRGLLSVPGANASLISVFVDGFFQEPVDVASLFNIQAVQVFLAWHLNVQSSHSHTTLSHHTLTPHSHITLSHHTLIPHSHITLSLARATEPEEWEDLAALQGQPQADL